MKAGVTVELIDVGMSYGQRRLFASLNAVVSPGECLAVTGKNGVGKSTLLKIIAGLVRPTEGEANVRLSGEKLDAQDRPAVLGLVSPEIVFYNALSGLENLLFFCHLRKLSLSSAALRAYLTAAGLGAHFEKSVATYSTGMRQRLKFAMLLALNPTLLLLDEPASNLDDNGKKLADSLIRTALFEEKTVVIATNEAWEAEYACRTLEIS